MRKCGLCLMMLLMMAAGCAHDNTKGSDVVRNQMVPPVQPEYEAPFESPGSLWNPNAKFADMYADAKARRVGDIIMVQIVENSSASKEAKSSADKSSSYNSGITNFFGLPLDKASIWGNDLSPTVTASTSSEYEGNGSTSRKGDVTGVVTARVVRVLPSGNLMIEGKKQITLNAETQYIMLSGIVRPEDITPNNVTQSNYIADLQLGYYGTGVIGDQQRRGFLSRAVDKVWPF